MKNHKKLKGLAELCAKSLLDSDSNAATRAATEYLVDHMGDDLTDSDEWDERTPLDTWDNARENLEVEIIDGLVKFVPDAEWNEDEMQALVMTFLQTIDGSKDRIVDEVGDMASDSRAYSRNPHSYYGVKPSDF